MKRILIVSSILLLLHTQSAHSTREYWQQDVSYYISVKLLDDRHTLLGTAAIIYQNNSPDTLTELRFHAYYNALQPGSPTDRAWRKRGNNAIKNAPSEDYPYLKLLSVYQGYYKLEPILNHSIFTVPLLTPLSPGDSVTLHLDFESRIPGPSLDLRSSWAHDQLKVSQWYPQVCVYDPVMGWVDNQYLGRGEAYGEFGHYHVELTLPEPYIVGATGELLNREEVLPDTLLSSLQLTKFRQWPWEKPPETIYSSWERKKTWFFHAENVHDFAWVADPQFRLDSTRCGETTIWVLARQEHASGWQDAAQVIRDGMTILEREVGPFPYPEFTVADCFSGMEYPGIIFCGGRSPDYLLLLWHEMAHNYFMGALGSNQVDRPFMDEGFTTYWEIRIMDEILGRYNLPLEQWGPWSVADQDRWYRGLRPYLTWQKSSFALPLHIESDLPDVYMQYRVSAYYKPVCMLSSLENQVGTAGIRRIMQAYYQRWRFRHPYEQDFLRSSEETLGTSLQWWYDAWVRDTKELDYSISERGFGSDSTVITLRRSGDMILPVKAQVVTAERDSITYYVPLDNEPTPPDCRIRLPRWDQLRDPNRLYYFAIPGRIHSARLDPQGLLADLNPLNNRTGPPPVKFEFDHPLEHVSPVDAYRICWTPSLFYNGVDGMQMGVSCRGDYLERWQKVGVTLRAGAQTGRISANLSYRNDLQVLGRGSEWGLSGNYGEGQRGGEIFVGHTERKGVTEPAIWQGELNWFVQQVFDRSYLPVKSLWEDGIISALHLSAGCTPPIGHFSLFLGAEVESAAPLSDFDYCQISGKLGGTYTMSSVVFFNLSSFLGASSIDTPVQRWFGLGGGSALDQASVSWLRSWGSFPNRWTGRVVGAGDLPGYNSVEDYDRSVGALLGRLTITPTFINQSVGKLKLPSRWHPNFNCFLFGGAGDLSNDLSSLQLKELRGVAGLGVTCSFPEGHSVELACPLYLSDPLSGEKNWGFRAVMGFFPKKN